MIIGGDSNKDIQLHSLGEVSGELAAFSLFAWWGLGVASDSCLGTVTTDDQPLIMRRGIRVDDLIDSLAGRFD